MILLYLSGGLTVEVDDMGFDQAASLHAGGRSAFAVMARTHGRNDLPFRRMSIAVEHLVRIVEESS